MTWNRTSGDASRPSCPLWLLLVVSIMGLQAHCLAQEKVDFSSQILPLLSDRCFLCHGPDEATREADLRLDLEADAMEYAVVPGSAEESELIARIFADDPDVRMPPPESNLSLSAAEKQRLRDWIEQGAQWDQHWAFVPLPEVVPVPRVEHVEWVNNDVDRFVLAQLEQRDIRPAMPATREALIRRVSFDLTGLPPTLEEVDAFVQDERENAYERLVDRLLASPRYGERMAVDWLDVARYADTYGYQNDRYREMWPWRDWVVQSFNDNLPWNDFVTWQLAGDLLPDPSREQVLATAFNRNHRQTNEGGSIEEEFRIEYVADRVNTFGAAFLGLTLECCRCHDHKYDPITQKEYYQLSAFFDNIDESGLYSHFTDAVPTPALLLPTDEQEQKLADARAAVAAAEEELLDAKQNAEERFRKWLSTGATPSVPASRGLIGHFSFTASSDSGIANSVNAEASGHQTDSPETVPGAVGDGVLLSGDNSVSVPSGGDFRRDDPFSLSVWLNAPRHVERNVLLHRSRAWTDSGSQGYELLLEDGRLSAALIHFWPGDAIRVQARDPLPLDTWVQVTVTYDGSSRAAGLQIYTNGRPVETEVVRDHLTKSIRSSVNALAVGQRFRDVGFKDGRVDELRVFNVELTPSEVRAVYDVDVQKINASAGVAAETDGAGRTSPGPRGSGAPAELFEYYLHAIDEPFQDAIAGLRRARQQRSAVVDSIRSIMVMQELPKPRVTHLLSRGAYDAPAEQVSAETPQALGTLSSELPSNRLGLAQWLTNPRHPLLARVTVNRFWQMLFGKGLVTTTEDFGRQGSAPSHPQLLDYLARDLVASGWNVKALLKQIVMSATYRQDSDCPAALRQQDPENLWLARGPVRRLSAEMLRDNALAASGLLVEKRGGPPVKPYQPPGLWKEKSGQTYQRDVGEGSHRRSLYTYWKRTSQPPAMMTFDASNREVCVVNRQVTMTPLQVLVLWNDPQFVEAAAALAERSMQTYPDRVPDQIRFVFRTLTGRAPEEREVAVLQELFREQQDEFASGRSDATALLATGDHRVDESLDPSHVAALSIVVQGVFSYDEVVMCR